MAPIPAFSRWSGDLYPQMMFRRRRRATLVILTATVAGIGLFTPGLPARDIPPMTAGDARARACALPVETLQRIERGYVDGRSPDVTTVPEAPNYLGSFEVASHSGPWDYLQDIPLVLYGPGRVPAGVVAERPVTLADVYPTVGRMLDVDLPSRSGASLVEALEDRSGIPRLVVVVVWDGVGRNVLERWPDAWPNLALLEQQGTTYFNASVGSSPSITPSAHSTLGTGAWPNEHMVSGIQFRDGSEIAVSFSGRDPSVLRLPTFADLIDLELDNKPKVGLVGWRAWHLGMMGHGAAWKGGDRDHLALVGFGGHLFGQTEVFSTPGYLGGSELLSRRIRELDALDGTVDGAWREHDVATSHDNSAWVSFETDVVLQLLEREHFGRDRVPDLLFVNYKMTDIVGHRHSMDSVEMEDVLRAQDTSLKRLVDYLDRRVSDYVLFLTADHGHTPSPDRTGAWPIDQDELAADLDDRFDVPLGQDLTLAVTAVGPFLDHEVMAELDVDASEVARFLNSYTIGDNASGPLPDGYESRRNERIFSAAFPSDELGEVAECAGLR